MSNQKFETLQLHAGQVPDPTTNSRADTLKAKNLFEKRKELINRAISEFNAKNYDKCFNFDMALKNCKKDVGKNWKSITEKDPEANKTFPIIDSANIEKLRSAITEDLSTYMKDNYPSLKKDL